MKSFADINKLLEQNWHWNSWKFNSMPNRYNEVLAKNGSAARYQYFLFLGIFNNYFHSIKKKLYFMNTCLFCLQDFKTMHRKKCLQYWKLIIILNSTNYKWFFSVYNLCCLWRASSLSNYFTNYFTWILLALLYYYFT